MSDIFLLKSSSLDYLYVFRSTFFLLRLSFSAALSRFHCVYPWFLYCMLATNVVATILIHIMLWLSLIDKEEIIQRNIPIFNEIF